MEFRQGLPTHRSSEVALHARDGDQEGQVVQEVQLLAGLRSRGAAISRDRMSSLLF